VNVKGGILYLDKKAELVVQFIIDKDNETFSYNASEINGIPQNNFVFWGLLETIYNADPVSTASSSREVSRSNSNTASSGSRIVIGETQIYDDFLSAGIVEVTLEYAEFVNRAPDIWGGLFNNPWLAPDPGNTYLCIEYTVRNIGTTTSSFMPSIGELVYDGVYKFDSIMSDPPLSLNQNALSPAKTATVYYMIPDRVVESNGPLVVRFGGTDYEDMSFVIRPGSTGGRSRSGMSLGTVEIDTYYVEKNPAASDEFQPALILHPAGRFSFYVNLYAGTGLIHGTYYQSDNLYTFNVIDRDFSKGFLGGDVDTFYMAINGDRLTYQGGQIGMTESGALLYKTKNLPLIIQNTMHPW
jgi:hypothetical protein